MSGFLTMIFATVAHDTLEQTGFYRALIGTTFDIEFYNVPQEQLEALTQGRICQTFLRRILRHDQMWFFFNLENSN